MSKKFYINTKRPNLDLKKVKEAKITFNDDTHGVHGEKTERFSQLKKRLQKRTV
jgi:hypothetical protein